MQVGVEEVLGDGVGDAHRFFLKERVAFEIDQVEFGRGVDVGVGDDCLGFIGGDFEGFDCATEFGDWCESVGFEIELFEFLNPGVHLVGFEVGE